MLRVLHLEDHTSLRGAVAFMLEREPDIAMVIQAGSVAEARCLLPTMPIDVALIDLNLPDGSGLDLLPSLREHHPAAAAVVLTGSARPESPALAVAAGAVGFLHKTVCIEDIVAAIRRVAAGEILFTPEEVTTYLCKAAQYQLRTRNACQALARLTPREQEVLRALAAGLDNQAISERLFLSTTTVRTHIGQILFKLGVNSRLQAALIAVRYGSVEPEDDD
jgi:DNA-binding NarL/FixJ family response regulator